ncbi:NHL repeat-containing protein [bacterium]|nr:NHL repeat-containing protein [bacterium]
MDVVPEFSGINRNQATKLWLDGPTHYDYQLGTGAGGSCKAYELKVENYYGNSVQIRNGETLSFDINPGMWEFGLYSEASCTTPYPMSPAGYDFTYAEGEVSKKFYLKRDSFMFVPTGELFFNVTSSSVKMDQVDQSELRIGLVESVVLEDLATLKGDVVNDRYIMDGFSKYFHITKGSGNYSISTGGTSASTVSGPIDNLESCKTGFYPESCLRFYASGVGLDRIVVKDLGTEEEYFLAVAITGSSGVNSYEGTGAGDSDSNPYLIQSTQDLYDLARYGCGLNENKHCGKFFKIDDTTVVDLISDPFPMIGSVEHPFTGSFNGNSTIVGTRIDNLHINAGWEKNVGLFRVVKNINAYSPQIFDLTIGVNVIAGGTNIGSLAGYYAGADGSASIDVQNVRVIQNSSFLRNMHSNVDWGDKADIGLGGLIGEANNVYLDYAQVIINQMDTSQPGPSSGGSNAGGMIGKSYGNLRIEKSYVKRSDPTTVANAISGSYNAGGMIGLAKNTDVIINESYVTASVASRSAAGGFIGKFEGTSLAVTNSFYGNGGIWAAPNIIHANGETYFAGGIIGEMASGSLTINTVYSLADLGATANNAGLIGLDKTYIHENGSANINDFYWLESTSNFSYEIDASTNPIVVPSFVKDIGSNDPSDVAYDSKGNIYFASNINNNIKKVMPNGNHIFEFGGYGAGQGRFDGPSGLAVDSSDNLYVVDMYNNRVQKFDSNGVFLMEFGENGSNLGQFNSPTDIAIYENGSVYNIYVVDSGNDRIQKFDKDGNPVGEMPVSLSTYSERIAVSSTGVIYVSKLSDVSKIVFGVSQTQLTLTSGVQDVALNSADDVYITYSGLGKIKVFDKDGISLPDLINNVATDVDIGNTDRIDADNNGNLILLDTTNNRVQIIDPDGGLIPFYQSKDDTTSPVLSVDVSFQAEEFFRYTGDIRNTAFNNGLWTHAGPPGFPGAYKDGVLSIEFITLSSFDNERDSPGLAPPPP